MKNCNLKSMSVDELWELHESVADELSQKIMAERATLEDRLRKLKAAVGDGGSRRARRPYPKVLPKYRNPKNRSETWAGRGKQPLWLAAQLRSGKKLTDFLIRRTPAWLSGGVNAQDLCRIDLALHKSARKGSYLYGNIAPFSIRGEFACRFESGFHQVSLLRCLNWRARWRSCLR